MPELFERSAIKSMILANRFVRSATWEGLADDQGASTPRLVALMAELARGGVGLIITSHAFVRKDGRAGPWQLGACGQEHIAGLRNMAHAVHKENGKIVLQLSHAGCKAEPRLTGSPVLDLSESVSGKRPSQRLTEEDIRLLSTCFAEAAGMARKVGFDGIQLHAAHCYLLGQFLSPHYNHRQDQYGGSITNRARALLETLEVVRSEVGNDYPVLVKINAEDTLDDGIQP